MSEGVSPFHVFIKKIIEYVNSKEISLADAFQLITDITDGRIVVDENERCSLDSVYIGDIHFSATDERVITNIKLMTSHVRPDLFNITTLETIALFEIIDRLLDTLGDKDMRLERFILTHS